MNLRISNCGRIVVSVPDGQWHEDNAVVSPVLGNHIPYGYFGKLWVIAPGSNSAGRIVK